MENVKFIVDSTSDIPKDFALENDIAVLGLPVIFEDGTTKLDWIEMDHDEFYERLEKSKNIPKTAHAPIETMEKLMKDSLKDHDSVLYITMSAVGSGTYQSANIAKANVLEEMPDARIEILDSKAYSIYIVIMLQEAIRLKNEGKSLDEIIEGAKMRRSYTEVLVVVDTLKYLEKGGRINKASLIAGTLLDLKPVLSVRGGLMESIDKFRGSKTIISKMIKKVRASDIDLDDPRFYIVHSQAPERAEQLWEAVKAEFGEDSKLNMCAQLGAGVGTHIGPGTLALFYKPKTPLKIYDD